MTHREAMLLALGEAEAALAQDEVPVGAVVVKDGRVLAAAHNRTEQNGCATAHAELLALQAAAEALGSWRLSGCTLYATLEPCAMCTGAILNSRVDEIVFGAFDPEAGCCGSVLDLTDGLLNRRVRCVGGFMEAACAAPLEAYFRDKRKKPT